MSIPQSLRQELSKYRKRKRGIRNDASRGKGPIRYATPTASLSSKSIYVGPKGAYSQRPYMCDHPTEYRANIHSPAAQSPEYDPYEADSVHLSQTNELHFHSRQPARDISSSLDEGDSNKPVTPFEILSRVARAMLQNVMSDDAYLMTIDDFVDQNSYGQFLRDMMPEFTEIAHSLVTLRQSLPEDHPDIIKLKESVNLWLEHPEWWPKSENFGGEYSGSNLGQGNPYDNDDIQQVPVHDTVRGIIHPFNPLSPRQNTPLLSNEIEEPAMLFEQSPASVDDAGHVANLEQTIEAEYAAFDYSPQLSEAGILHESNPTDFGIEQVFDQDIGHNLGLAINEINQAIDQVVNTDPFQLQHNPFMEPEYMFNQQYMPHYMVPGPMPMGPMPGPAPGM